MNFAPLRLEKMEIQRRHAFNWHTPQPEECRLQRNRSYQLAPTRYVGHAWGHA